MTIVGEDLHSIDVAQLAQEAGEFFPSILSCVQKEVRFAGFVLRNGPNDKPAAELRLDQVGERPLIISAQCGNRAEGLPEIYQKLTGEALPDPERDPFRVGGHPIAAVNDLMDALLPAARGMTGQEDPRYELWVRHFPREESPFNASLTLFGVKRGYAYGGKFSPPPVSGSSAQVVLNGIISEVLYFYAEHSKKVA